MSGIIAGKTDEDTLYLPSVTDNLSGISKENEVTGKKGKKSCYGRVHSGDADGLNLIEHSDSIVLIYGHPTTFDGSSPDKEELVNITFNEPSKFAKFDGSFLVVGISESDMIVATDKLGARAAYLVADRPIVSTQVSALLPFLSDVNIDEQAVSDMLLMGHLWGERTLISGIQAARPSTIYEYSKKGWTESRYWKPDYTQRSPGKPYISELAKRFNDAVEKTSCTLPKSSGIWLSGGLDSRNTASVLAKIASQNETTLTRLSTYTYDANPPTGDNPDIAREVASKFNVTNTQVDLTPARFNSERVERIIDKCDGAIQWGITKNLSPSYDLVEENGVLLEGVEGSLLGDHLLQSHFSKPDDAMESQLMSEAATSVDVVSSLMNSDVDPLSTFRSEINRTEEQTFRRQVLDIHFQNYYNRLALVSNVLMRDVAGSRVVYNDGEFLSWCAGLPLKYRKATFPFTKKIPVGTSRAKIGLTQELGLGGEDITYERTKVPPKYPYPFHVGGFICNVINGRIRSELTYGNGQLADVWLRMDTDLSKWAERKMTKAAQRDLFNDEIMDVWRKHQNGENNSSIIASITTIEHWIETHLE